MKQELEATILLQVFKGCLDYWGKLPPELLRFNFLTTDPTYTQTVSPYEVQLPIKFSNCNLNPITAKNDTVKFYVEKNMNHAQVVRYDELVYDLYNAPANPSCKIYDYELSRLSGLPSLDPSETVTSRFTKQFVTGSTISNLLIDSSVASSVDVQKVYVNITVVVRGLTQYTRVLSPNQLKIEVVLKCLDAQVT